MSPGQAFAADEGFLDEADRRKRLGQYFTGMALGRVLATLAAASTSRHVIDPMAGSGDLLAACLEVGGKPSCIAGIEIDPIAHEMARRRLPKATNLLGSAFDPAVISLLPRRDWDLVITNPPYVRYQSLAKAAGKDFRLPGALEVRNGLLACLEQMPALDDEDRNAFEALAANYSGLADLAVPSWILCAAMVAIGGRLALVVPESWLSREYAAVVQYVLLRWFEVEHIVEDGHAAWFSDAQVRTALVIARRTKRRLTAFDWSHECFVRSKISGTVGGAAGPVAGIFPGEPNPELLLARKAKSVLNTGRPVDTNELTMFAAPIATLAQSLHALAHRQRWFVLVGESSAVAATICDVPQRIAAWLEAVRGEPQLAPLESLGIAIGQGLRTGANGFFYATLLAQNSRSAVVAPEGVPGVESVRIPVACLWPVLRRQSELPHGFVIRRAGLAGRALDLRSVALPEDIKAGGALARDTYKPMTQAVADFVRKSDSASFATAGTQRRIRTFTAVATNVRHGDSSKGIPPRFWYMLPDFAPRHAPDLVVPRINSGPAKAYLVADRGILVDANFSTLNVRNVPGITAHAVFALINSAWCRTLLEHSAAVMGGGALKVEAAHLRKLPIPTLSPAQWRQLSRLGQDLAKTGAGGSKIDKLVTSAVLGRASVKAEVAELIALGTMEQSRRAGKKKARYPGV